jgi:hypothetical protein
VIQTELGSEALQLGGLHIVGPHCELKSFRIRTYAKAICNPFRIRSYESKGPEVLYNPHLQKNPGG